VPEQTETLFALANPIARRVWADAAACTAVSTFVQELATNAYDRSVARIVNGVELNGAQLPFFPPTHPRHLVFVGRMSVQKNPVFLVDALSQITQGRWRATFVGDGPLMPAVAARIRERQLGERVKLAGWLDAPAVGKLLRSADVMAMPSLSEGMPIAAIEALKHGLAIVTTDIPGTLDVVEDGVNGCRIRPGDVTGFARALERLVTDDQLVEQMRRASWAKVRAFDLESIIDEYERVLKGAAARGDAAIA
jgi:glycosyltransferase involved in cell wall biosynthesis